MPTAPDGASVRRCLRTCNRLGVSEGTVAYYRRAGRIYAYKRPRPRVSGNAGVWMHSKADLKALLNDPQFQKRRAARQKAEDTRLLKAVEWIARVNGWDDPRHEWDYQASPGPVW